MKKSQNDFRKKFLDPSLFFCWFIIINIITTIIII